MMLTWACFAVARLGQTEVDIPVQYRRPSKLASLIQSSCGASLSKTSSVSADDPGAKLVVIGTQSDAEQVRKVVALVDQPRSRAEIEIGVDAPADKVHYNMMLQLYGGQAWTTEDLDLGLRISFVVGPQDKGKLTLHVITEYQRHNAESTFRLAVGKPMSQTFGQMLVDDPYPGVHRIEKSPTITFKYTGLHGE